MWGCGLTHQLANRPRDVSNPIDTNEEPADELKPYRVSSKQLQKRFVMLADGGAQHSVELAWDGAYSAPSQDGAGTGQPVASEETAVNEPPSKRARHAQLSDLFQIVSAASVIQPVQADSRLLSSEVSQDEAITPELVSEAFTEKRTSYLCAFVMT